MDMNGTDIGIGVAIVDLHSALYNEPDVCEPE